MPTAPDRRRGRRSLNGAGDSPQLRLRLSDELRNALHRRAALEGMTVSELARRLLTDATAERRENRVQLELYRRRLTGPLGIRLKKHRRELVAAAATHGLTNLRVFGSVARGEDRPDSDIDLLVDVPEGMGLIGFGQACTHLERILGARVDLIPADGLKSHVALSAIADVLPL